MTKIEEPVETIGMQDSKQYTHPAFGQIQASRVSAYITNVISRAGLEALGGQAPLMLNSGEKDATG